MSEKLIKYLRDEPRFRMAINCLFQLKSDLTESGVTRALQISTSDYHRVYIHKASCFQEPYFIIHNEYDVNSKSNHTVILDQKNTIRYINTFDDIVFIGIDTSECYMPLYTEIK